jgi:AraC-like DNA-binding protein
MGDPLALQPAPTRYFLIVLRRFGSTPELRQAILDGVGLTPEQADASSLEISLRQQVQQAANMNRLFGDGWLLEAPELWRPSAHAALGVAMVNAPTVGRAVEVMTMHLGAVMPGLGFQLVAEGQTTAVRFAAATPLTDSWEKVLAELILLSAASSLGWLLGEAAGEMTYEYQWAEPAYGARLAQTLGGGVRWAAKANAVRVPTGRLALQSPFADPPLFGQALGRLRELATAGGGAGGLRGQVERLLARSESGRIPVQAAAQSLGVSHRTLERRLADEGAHFRELVDAELKVRARRMLTAKVLTRTEIAEQLGFADVTGFSRASRRWFRGED